MRKIILFILFALIFASNSLAYIDPGTAGMVIGGGLWPLIVALLAAVSGFFLKFLIFTRPF